MAGVYRIQTFFGFLYFFYIYKAPKPSVFCHVHIPFQFSSPYSCKEIFARSYKIYAGYTYSRLLHVDSC